MGVRLLGPWHRVGAHGSRSETILSFAIETARTHEAFALVLSIQFDEASTKLSLREFLSRPESDPPVVPPPGAAAEAALAVAPSAAGNVPLKSRGRPNEHLVKVIQTVLVANVVVRRKSDGTYLSFKERLPLGQFSISLLFVLSAV